MAYAGAMKKLLKFMGWLAGVVLLLLITAHFTLRHALNTPKFKEAVTGFIQRTTGRTAEYARIDYTLFPFSLVVHNAALKERDGTGDFAAMNEFSASVDFRAQEISALKLVEPAIRIVQHPDGSYNFSDLLPAPEAKPKSDGTGAPAAGRPASAPEAAPKARVAAPLAIRLVQIEKASLEFVKQYADRPEETFTLTDLDFQLQDFAPDRPVRISGSATLGRKSSFQFELSGPPPGDYRGKFETWPVGFNSCLDLRDFADLEAFLPPGTRPLQSLWATMNIQGAPTDRMTVLLNLATPSEPTGPFLVALQAGLQAELKLPVPVAAHLLAGAPLPDDFRFNPPVCAPPPGSMALTGDPLLALLLKHLDGTANLTFPQFDFGWHHFTEGRASLELHAGVLTITEARLATCGGTLDARGKVQLLDCPLAYWFDRLAADNLALEQVLAANGLGAYTNFSGRLQLEASASGSAVAEPGLKTLVVDATTRIDNLQSVGAGGSLMDQVWMQLDQPLLLKLVPRLKSMVEQAKANAANITTSRYDTATATLSLRNGKAALSGTRLSLPGYRFKVAGAIWPFNDRLDLGARLIATPEETAALTDGKDLSAYLPYEEGGLMIPMTIRGTLHRPAVLPDLDRLLQNALAGVTNGDLGRQLDQLSDSDKKHVEQGLQILQGLGTLLDKP